MKHPNARIEVLLNALPASSQLPAIDLKIERITKLLAALGNPHEKLPPVVHVAGTNGKGSLLAYLTAILQAAGYRVHRYTSPHLVYFNERIMLAGKEIADDYLLSLLERVAEKTKLYPVTFFEVTTAAAFLAFAETAADIVLLETGLGGRLDATNMVRSPVLTAITPISMDHTEFLGNTLAAIAGEKAGIIKAGVPCVVGPQTVEAFEVIERVSNNKNAVLYSYGSHFQANSNADKFHYKSEKRESAFPIPNLVGAHQVANAATAIACVDCLGDFTITPEHIAQGITHAVWPGRMQRLESGNLAQMLPSGSELWVDGGHNPGAGEILAQWAKIQTKPIHIICGMLKNKDTKEFLSMLAPYTKSLTAVAIDDQPQAQDPEVISTIASSLDIRSRYINEVRSAIELIVKEEKNGSIILACGSLYLVGNILWQNGHQG